MILAIAGEYATSPRLLAMLAVLDSGHWRRAAERNC
jgi:hypothetical protein